MPRDFDSDDIARRTGAVYQLRFTENVECPICFTVFDGEFFDTTGSMTVEDMAEPPIGIHTCPACRHKWGSVYTGWQFYSEAG
jgi:uncharacterized protein (DUF2225 family)